MGPPGDPGKEGIPVCTSDSISCPCSVTVHWLKSNETLWQAEMRKKIITLSSGNCACTCLC